ncbi:hypothetical protein ACFSO0_13480 [Brevibacillus sp. GCM10020057]|uniref:hypothetical protein n=1 Tax=Brevibacillus sp. GCM10020057 TaxID=3317327 RepID=UPI003629C80D
MKVTDPDSFKGMTGRMVRIHSAGSSHQGRLLAVKDDYLALQSDDQCLYLQTHQVKSIAIDTTRNLPIHTSCSPLDAYMDAENFADLLEKMKYRFVLINQNGPERIRGILTRCLDNHVDLVNGHEFIRVPVFHIKDICHDRSKKEQKTAAVSKSEEKSQPSEKHVKLDESEGKTSESVTEPVNSAHLLTGPELVPPPAAQITASDHVTSPPHTTTPEQTVIPSPIAVPAPTTVPDQVTIPAKSNPTEQPLNTWQSASNTEDQDSQPTDAASAAANSTPQKLPPAKQARNRTATFVPKFRKTYRKSKRIRFIKTKNRLQMNKPTFTTKRQWATVKPRKTAAARKLITKRWYFTTKNLNGRIWLAPFIRCGYSHRTLEGRASK